MIFGNVYIDNIAMSAPNWAGPIAGSGLQLQNPLDLLGFTYNDLVSSATDAEKHLMNPEEFPSFTQSLVDLGLLANQDGAVLRSRVVEDLEDGSSVFQSTGQFYVQATFPKLSSAPSFLLEVPGLLGRASHFGSDGIAREMLASMNRLESSAGFLYQSSSIQSQILRPTGLLEKIHVRILDPDTFELASGLGPGTILTLEIVQPVENDAGPSQDKSKDKKSS